MSERMQCFQEQNFWPNNQSGLQLFSVQGQTNKSGLILSIVKLKIVSEYDQEIPQSQTADNPVAPRGRAAQPPRDTRKTI